MDYAQLKSDLASWLNRDDLTAVIPSFISLAEATLNRQLRVRDMLVRDTAIIDEDFENLPADFLELKAIWWNTTPRVIPQYRPPFELSRLRVLMEGSSSPPEHFTLLGSQILFDRKAAGGPELEILSYVRIPPLSDTNPSNTLLANHPDLYLYGSLVQAEPYLKNDQRLPTWVALYEKARDDLLESDKQGETSPSPLVMTSSRRW